MINIDEILNEQKNYFIQGNTLDINFRIEKLKNLKSAIINYKEKIAKALHQDLRKSEFEAYTTEILPVLSELSNSIKNVKKWAEKEMVNTPVFLSGFFGSNAESFILREPYGNVLIISPFNYPFQLAIMPLIGAIAAGNTAIIKPSSDTQNTTKILMEMINSIFPREFVYVIEPKNILHFDLLNKKYDYIFFTGGTQTGKKVMEAASKNLTPVTLELGGKSPVIIDKNVNLDNAVQSIVRGKLMNAGQTCIAPDYTLVHQDIKEIFVQKLITAFKNYAGIVPQESKNLGRIINETQFSKLKEIIDKERENLVFGGEYDECGLYISPTILDIKSFDSFVMQNEIFGPILPILTYENFFDMLKILKTREKPLAAYIFSENENNIETFLKNFSFGGGCVNDTMLHIANGNLPFGGVGFSGIGAYHGRYTFETFSHRKSVFKKRGDKIYKFLSPVNDEQVIKIKKTVKFI